MTDDSKRERAPWSRGRRPEWLACLAIVAAVALAHGGAARNGFVQLDDQIYVYENPTVSGGLSLRSAAWAFHSGARYTYFHPLTWLSLLVDVELFGVDARAIHAENVALHATAAVLFFLALASATGRRWPSLLAALLFAVHPITVEGVAWAAERKTVLSSALGAAAILAYVIHARRPTRARLLLVCALLAASLLARPGLVVLPGLLLVLDFWPLGRLGFPGAGAAASRPPLRDVIVEKVPLAAISAALLAIIVWSARLHDLPPTPFSLRLAYAVTLPLRYLASFAWPAGLSVFHPYPSTIATWAVASSAAAVLALTALAVAAARRAPWWLAGWAWFLVCLLPYLGLKQSGLWPSRADRFAYLAILGPAVAVAFGAADLARRSARAPAAVAGAAALAVLALGVATHRQVGFWKDSLTLFERAVRIEPGSAVMRFNLGIHLWNAGRADEAIAQVGEAVRLEPDDMNTRYTLGTYLGQKGRLAEAAVQLEIALALDPRSTDAHVQLGTVYQLLGRLADAEAHFRAAAELDPSQPEALYNWAQVLRARGRLEEARPLYRRFLAIAGDRYAAQRAMIESLVAVDAR